MLTDMCTRCRKPSATLHAVTKATEGNPAVLWCMACLEKHEPEMARNAKEDMAEAADIIDIAKDLGFGIITF